MVMSGTCDDAVGILPIIMPFVVILSAPRRSRVICQIWPGICRRHRGSAPRRPCRGLVVHGGGLRRISP